ncbi:hypothetical protein AB0C65_31880 [Nocardia sp. NPDC048505]|uniref:hypothetical protein n=1 Tax=Nocardia sp. NPDC048505 TaxID=3155756 RepID=UPI0033CE9954
MRIRGKYWAGIVAALVIGLVLGAVLARLADGNDFGPRGRTISVHDVGLAELVLFVPTRGLPPEGDAILRSAAEVTQYAGRFANYSGVEQELVQEKLSGRDMDRETLIAFTWGGTCAPGDGAKLTTADGGASYSTRLTGASDGPEECYARWEHLAVFAMPKGEVRPDARLATNLLGAPGPASLLAFERIDRTDPRGMEISQLDQLETFLRGLPPGTADSIRAEVLDRGRDLRAFGFVLLGCQNDSAYLAISKQQLHPVPTGGENIRCVTADHYLAVFTVPAEFVPASARIG